MVPPVVIRVILRTRRDFILLGGFGGGGRSETAEAERPGDLTLFSVQCKKGQRVIDLGTQEECAGKGHGGVSYAAPCDPLGGNARCAGPAGGSFSSGPSWASGRPPSSRRRCGCANTAWRSPTGRRAGPGCGSPCW